MKGILVNKRSEQEQQEQDLIAACDLVRRDTIKLQEQLSKKRAAARKKLTDLSLHSDAASKKLKALIAKVMLNPDAQIISVRPLTLVSL